MMLILVIRKGSILTLAGLGAGVVGEDRSDDGAQVRVGKAKARGQARG